MVLGWKNLMLSFLKVLWAKFKSTSFMWEEMVHDNKLTHSLTHSPGFSVGKWLFTLTRRKRIHSYNHTTGFFFFTLYQLFNTNINSTSGCKYFPLKTVELRIELKWMHISHQLNKYRTKINWQRDNLEVFANTSVRVAVGASFY